MAFYNGQFGHYPHQFLPNAQGSNNNFNQFPAFTSASGQSSGGPNLPSTSAYGYTVASNPGSAQNVNSPAYSNPSGGFQTFNAISSSGNPTSQLQNAFQSFQNLWYSQTNTYSTSTVATQGTATAIQQGLNRNDFNNTTQNVLYQNQMSRFPQAMNYLQQQAALQNQGQFKNSNSSKTANQTNLASQSQSSGWNAASTTQAGFNTFQQTSNKPTPSSWNSNFQQQKDWPSKNNSTYQSPYQSQPTGYFGNAGGDFNWPNQTQQSTQSPQNFNQGQRNNNAFQNAFNNPLSAQPSANRTAAGSSLTSHEASGIAGSGTRTGFDPTKPPSGSLPPSNFNIPQNFNSVPTSNPPQWNPPPPGPNWQQNNDPRRRNERNSFIPPFPEAWQGNNGSVRQPTPQMPSEQGGWGDHFGGSWTGPPVGNQWPQQQTPDFESGNRPGQNSQNRFAREQQNRNNSRYSPKSRGEKSDRELWTPGDSKKQPMKLDKPKAKDETVAKDGPLQDATEPESPVVENSVQENAVQDNAINDTTKVPDKLTDNVVNDDYKDVKEQPSDCVDKSIQSTEIKSYLYAWLGMRHRKPAYEMQTLGERPDQTFRCELHVHGYKFVGIGEASTKKEAQTEAAWNFVDFLVKENEMKESELPPKQKKNGELTNGGSPDVAKDVNKMEIKNNKYEVPNNIHNKRDRIRQRPPLQPNLKLPPGGKIPSLLSIVTTPRNLPPMPPPYLFERMPEPWVPPQHPPFRIRHWEGPRGLPHPLPPHIPHIMPPHPHGFPPPGPMGPPIGLPPMIPHHGPMHRRGGPRPDEFWRHQREMEEQQQWFEEIQNSEMHPEDVFISRMIKNQQEAARISGGGRPPPNEGLGGDWSPIPPGKMRNVLTLDDRHVMAKHAIIYPHEDELKAVHEIVTVIERALKSLSDQFVDEDHPFPKDDSVDDETNESTKNNEDDASKTAPQDGKKPNDVSVKAEGTPVENAENNNDAGQEDDKSSKDEEDRKRTKIQILKRPKKRPKKVPDTRPRVLCGVNRVGPLAKGLLIHGDSDVALVLLCGSVPTETLRSRIMKHLPEKIEEVKSDLKYHLEEDECGFSVIGDLAVPIKLSVAMTSTTLKSNQDKTEEPAAGTHDKEEEKTKENSEVSPDRPSSGSSDDRSPEGMLPKPLLLRALAQLRHAKWFQAKASQIESCVVITRILRDMQCRIPAWSHMSCWALENLVYISLSTSTEHMSLGDALRRFFEVVAGGVLLPDSSGIQDPCERIQTDVLNCCTAQQLENITKHAQHSLLRIAFREIYEVLGIEKIIPNQGQHRHQSYNIPSTPGTPSSVGTDDEASAHHRKRKNPPTNNDTFVESPKRTLTDEEGSNNDNSEHTDTQQTLAELTISENQVSEE